MSSTHRPFDLLALVTFGLGIGALALSWAASPLDPSAAFFLLLAAAIVSENYSVSMPGISVSIAYPLTIAAMVLCGPTPAILVAVMTSANIVDIRGRQWALNAFNFGQLALSTLAASWAYVLLGGRVLLETGSGFTAPDFPRMFLPLLAVTVVSVGANIVLASIGVAVKRRMSLLQVMESMARLPWGQAALGVVGFVIAQVMATNVAAFALFIFPLLIARQFYQRFTALESAYTDTIRSLVGALEAKDPYTRGHSERVAEYSILLAQQSGIEGRALTALENAALLHDLGKLALSGALLRKTEKLDNDDWEAIRRHPALGAEMVRKIPAVAALADSVEMHHERLNGSGYPRGISADLITREARILAIADSYDAMTSDRPYREGLSSEQALAELRRCSVDELDAGLVDAFISAVQAGEQSAPVVVAEASPAMGGE